MYDWNKDCTHTAGDHGGKSKGVVISEGTFMAEMWGRIGIWDLIRVMGHFKNFMWAVKTTFVIFEKYQV